MLIAIILQLTSGNATMVKKLSEDELTNQAESIVIGTCTSVRSEWNEEGTKIFTYITISAEISLKGDQSPQEIIIKQPGGEVGEIGMHVDGVSVFEKGEEVILFLEKGPKGFHRPLGLFQGKFSIETDPITQRKVLFQKSAKLVKTRDGKLEKKIFKIKSDKKSFLDEFTSRIQNILQRKSK